MLDIASGAKSNDEETKTRLEEIEKDLVSFFKPKSFHGPEGAEASFVRGFEATCTALTLNNVAFNPRHLTTLRFLLAVETLKGLLKTAKKRNKKE